MRTTNHAIKKIVTHPDRYHPENSTGKDVAETINGLIDITGANIDPSVIPDVPPAVVVDTVYDPNFPYLTGSEVRLPFGFFRCVEDMPANQNIGLVDKNHWDLFYIPSLVGHIYGGQYDENNHHAKGVVVFKIEPGRVLIMEALISTVAGTPYDPANFNILEQIDTVGSGGNLAWRGVHNATNPYAENDLTVFGNVVYQCNADIAAKTFDPADWTQVYAFPTPAYKGSFLTTASYNTGDTVSFANVDGNILIYEAKGPVSPGAFDSTQWDQKQFFYIGGRFKGTFSEVLPYNQHDTISRVNASGEMEIYSANQQLVAGAFNPVNWTLKQTIRVGGEWKGNFSDSDTYRKDDLALYDDGTGSLRIIQANEDLTAAPYDAAKWTTKQTFTKPALHITKAFCGGRARENEVLAMEVPIRNFQIPVGAPNSSAVALTAATAETNFLIKRDGTEVARFTFLAGSTTATINMPTVLNFTTAQQLTIQQDGPEDITLADISFTIEGKVV